MSAKITLPIHIIGAGCAGMRVARSLDELGESRIQSELTLWDGDTVEAQNIRAQLYGQEHYGLPKVEAASQIIPKWSKMTVIPRRQYVQEERVPLSGIVFVCVDSMAARKLIWEHSIKDVDDIALMIEMRLNTDTSTVHIVDPCLKRHQDMWEHYWYPDEDAANAGSCGSVTSLGPIANITADIAVWQIVRFCEIVDGSEDQLENQIQIRTRPSDVKSFSW